MRTITRRMATVPVALAWAVALGCTQESDEGAPPGPGGRDEAVEGAVEEGAPGGDGGGAPGIPGNGGGGGRGAPIKIPPVVERQGDKLDTVLEEIRTGLEHACGGELCVTLSVERTGDGFGECKFVGTDPPPESTVERGSTVVVIAGTEPCDDTTTSETSEGGTDEGSGTTEGSPDEELEEQPEGST